MNRPNREARGVANFHLWGKGKNAASSRDDTHDYHQLKSNVKIYPQDPYPSGHPPRAPETNVFSELERLRRVRQENVAIKSRIAQSTIAQNAQPKYREHDQPPSNYALNSSEDSKTEEVRWLENEMASRKASHTSSHRELERSDTDDKHMSGEASKASLRSNASVGSIKKHPSRRYDDSSDEEAQGNVEESDGDSEDSSYSRRKKKEKQRKGKGKEKESSKTSSKVKEKKGNGKRERKSKGRGEDSAVAMELQKIRDHMAAMIDDNRDIMDQAASSSEAGAGDLEELQQREKKRRQEMKSKINSLLSKGDTYRMPLWRHRLAGTRNPLPESVMRGKQLFRMAARLVLHFYVQPQLRVQQRRQGRKNADLDALMKNLILFLEACGTWLGKAVKLPVASILQVVALIDTHSHQ
jgi:hypothetical protein